jgi:hypothetical protein
MEDLLMVIQNPYASLYKQINGNEDDKEGKDFSETEGVSFERDIGP